MTSSGMEESWKQKKGRKRFVMKSLDLSNIRHDEADVDIIKIVVISDTHSAHESIAVPPGYNIFILWIFPWIYNF